MNKRTARKLAAEAISDAMAEAEWLLKRDWDLSDEERAAVAHQLRVIDRWAWARIRREERQEWQPQRQQEREEIG